MPGHHFYVYILTSNNGNAMYIGVTNSLPRRISEHQNGLIDGFTKTYHVQKLVYYEEYDDPRTAIEREKQLKKWSRIKKNRLVESMNPEWKEIPLTDLPWYMYD